jgi:Tfp pilus assembly protein PilV
VRGLGLIESLMAGFVLVIASLGVAASIAQGSGITDRTRNEARAWNAIRTVHSRLTADAFSTVATNFHQKGFGVPGLRAVDGDSDGLPGLIVMADVPDVPSCYMVTALVRWQSSRRVYSVRSRFFVGNVYGDMQAPPSLQSLESVEPTEEATQ